MDNAVIGALVAVLCVLTVTVLLTRSQRRLRDELDRTRAALADLEARVGSGPAADQATGTTMSTPPGARRAEDGEARYVITTAGLPPDLSPEASASRVSEVRPPMTTSEFTSVALGESLVRVVSLGYGVRRALSAPSRNRIRFEMRQAVKASRKRRRRELREARRHLVGEPRRRVDEDAA